MNEKLARAKTRIFEATPTSHIVPVGAPTALCKFGISLLVQKKVIEQFEINLWQDQCSIKSFCIFCLSDAVLVGKLLQDEMWARGIAHVPLSLCQHNLASHTKQPLIAFSLASLPWLQGTLQHTQMCVHLQHRLRQDGTLDTLGKGQQCLSMCVYVLSSLAIL